ncbi:MAG: MBL fold metallo-hydrolase [Paramuribaculum sp.]|nr:MBL fold metallo-hydrolase [Paramuribaculum sp.]
MQPCSSVTPTISYVGVDDTDLGLFENQYPVPTGISYNSYIIKGEKIALLDTVDSRRTEEWSALVSDVLYGSEPDYLVVLHMEPDHSSDIARTLLRYPGLKLVASRKALDMIPQFFEGIDLTGRSIAVKEGDTLDLGGRTLTFFNAPMVHWPEVVIAFDSLDKVLFTADAFGTFGALSYGQTDWTIQARRYYTNIVGKYGPQVQTLLKKVATLDIKAIAPLHGPILKDNLSQYIDLYNKWSTYTPETQGVLVAYASVYGGTEQAALRLADMIRAEGKYEVATIDLCRQDVSEAVAQAFRMSTLALASVTYDGALFPAMHHFLYHLRIKGLRNRRVGLIENGSWAPVAAKAMREMLGQMPGMEIVEPVVTIRSRMHTTDTPTLAALAASLTA